MAFLILLILSILTFLRRMCAACVVALRLDNRELRRRGGGLFGANPLTGSIGVVTINMAAWAIFPPMKRFL